MSKPPLWDGLAPFLTVGLLPKRFRFPVFWGIEERKGAAIAGWRVFKGERLERADSSKDFAQVKQKMQQNPRKWLALAVECEK
jgi:hypothetical protein